MSEVFMTATMVLTGLYRPYKWVWLNVALYCKLMQS